MDKLIHFIEENPKPFAILFFFLWGGFLIVFSLHTNFFAKTLYITAINALVVAQIYLGLKKKAGKRNWLGILLGSITGIYTLILDFMFLPF